MAKRTVHETYRENIMNSIYEYKNTGERLILTDKTDSDVVVWTKTETKWISRDRWDFMVESGQITYVREV